MIEPIKSNLPDLSSDSWQRSKDGWGNGKPAVAIFAGSLFWFNPLFLCGEVFSNFPFFQKIFPAAILGLAAPGSALVPNGSDQPLALKTDTVITGLKTLWALAILPDGDMLVTGRGGTRWLVHNGQLDPKPIEDVPEVLAKEQGGLLDVVLHPDYAKNGWIYLTYASPGERSQKEKTQDPMNHQGTVVRLYDDGRVPKDNPFVGGKQGLEEIYS